MNIPDKYIGLKYKENGRDFNGTDCWGLVRLYYKNELDINLPSFESDYSGDDESRIQELIAQYKEGWDQVQEPLPGCIVLFKVMGFESHVGIVLENGQFLHVRENSDSVIESLSNHRWKKRIVGYYKYSEKGNAVLSAIPHPLRTEYLTMPIPMGTKISEVVEGISEKYNLQEYNHKVAIMVNGVKVAPGEWETRVLKSDDILTFRTLPGKGNTLRLILMIAVAVSAPYLAGSLTGYASAVTAANLMGGTVTTGLALANSAATVGINMIGAAMIDKIAPIRPPGASDSPSSSSAEQMFMASGIQNQITPYASKLLVLGKVRLSPPHAVQPQLSFLSERDSFLSMIFEWGFGPLSIDRSSMRFGEVPLINYGINLTNGSNHATLDRILPDNHPTSIAQQNVFDKIYSEDSDQKVLSQTLICEGNPEWEARSIDAVYTIDLINPNVGYTHSCQINLPNTYLQPFTATFTVPVGVPSTDWFHESWGVVDLIRTNISPTTVSFTGKTNAVVGASLRLVYSTFSDTPLSISGSATLQGLNPGVWVETSTLQTNISGFTVALHFPQGLHKMKLQGADTGKRFGTRLLVRMEGSYDGQNWTPLFADSVSPSQLIQRNRRVFVGYDVYDVAIYNDVLETVEEYVPKRDPFTLTWNFSNDYNFVRVRRESGDDTAEKDSNPEWQYYHDALLHSVVFRKAGVVVKDPVGCRMAWTALSVKASDQLNGNFESFNAIVQSIAPTWNGSTWVDAPTSNPASLMIHVLTHPSNPRRKTLAQIDMVQMQYFYNYCQTRGFEYNSVLASKRSIVDLLRDVCAAGRASPHTIDGKETVVIDEPKSVTQHFTPHNSWGFEAIKNIPEIPHGIRVKFYNQDNGYQEEEIIVYDIGYNENNASLFEVVNLPGITKKSLVVDHVKFQMAQAKLRPETYTLNTDIENLVCSRGDRVKAVSDVTLWGLGSGRIKNRISSTEFELDESVPMEVGKTYSIRFRSKSNASTVRNVITPVVSGYFSTITLASSVTDLEADFEDLFLFGEQGSESQDLTVLSIERQDNYTARITLTDYGVTDTYNIFTDYLSLSEDTIFESQVTPIPIIQRTAFGTITPVTTKIVSDESVMDVVSKGVFRYNMVVSFINPDGLPPNTTSVEAEYALASSTDGLSNRVTRGEYINGFVAISGVQEGEQYKVRLRYISAEGRVGLWSNYSTHFIEGKRNPPGAVSGFVAIPEFNTGKLKLTWNQNSEPDIKGYEIRHNKSFGLQSGLVFDGDATNCLVSAPTTVGQSTTHYASAYDYFGNYSTLLAETSWSYPQVNDPYGLTATFEETALTTAMMTLTWSVPTTTFAVDYYSVSFNGTVRQVKGNTLGVPADWLGSRTFTIRAVDINGNSSNGVSISATQQLPGSPLNCRSQVVDNTVMLFWTLPERTTLPISHVRIKEGSSWSTATNIGEKKGEFTIIQELASGTFSYWIACVDISGNESLPVSLTTQVSEPPDFEFFGDFQSTLSGTKVNAIVESGGVVMPVNTTETWGEHFSGLSWGTPQNQITAGYPLYGQPTMIEGYYEEVFDYGNIIGSSKVTLNYNGIVSSGTPTVIPSISISADGVNYATYDGASSVFGTDFRYVKVRITTTVNDSKAMYKLTFLEVRLDIKKRYDTLNVQADSADTLGTIVNFKKEFVDVQTIILTANSTVPLASNYDFQDAVLSGTYSVTSGVCTVTYIDHGFITGQNIRLGIGSGLGATGVYPVTSYTSDTFTVTMPVSDTSGAVLLYPQSCRIYVWSNSGGHRESATVSIEISGY